MPRVELTGTANVAPLTAHVEGMTVYNTRTVNDVSPGYYYNNGVRWVRLAADSGMVENWSLTGNAGTNANNNFLGTTDNTALRFRTNNTNRFEITTGGNLRAFANGSNTAPTYSWTTNANMGMYRIGTNILGFSTAGAERMRIGANGNVGVGTVGNASQKIQVNGNFRLNGAFMPNNQAGRTDKILISKGANTAPVWGPGFMNTSQISNIGKFFSGPFNVNSSNLTLTISDSDMTTDTALAYNFVGALPTGPNYANLSIMVESRNGSIIFHIRNNTGYSLNNLQVVYTAFYN